MRSIAKRYCTSPEQLAENNGLSVSDELIEGEELIVAIPTRTYTVKEGDTLQAIARRFGVKRQDLLAINPSLDGQEKIYATKPLAIKYEKENLGMAAANGYVGKGCPKNALYRALPYLVYVTLTGAITDGESVYTQGESRDFAEEIKKHGKLPLLRIYDGSHGEFLNSKSGCSNLCDSMIDRAKDYGYSGVVFSSCNAAGNRHSEYADFILELRKRMIGSGLILITESDKDAKGECTDLADGNVLVYSKIDEENPGAFSECEAAALKAYAARADSSKTFVDICAHAYNGKSFIPLSDVRTSCRAHGAKIQTNPSTLLSEFTDKRANKTVYESLGNIKAKLRLVGELGYMGINVDVRNVPTSHLVMYHSMFSPVFHSSFYSDI